MILPNIRLREIYQLFHVIDADHFAGWPNLYEYEVRTYHLYGITNDDLHGKLTMRAKHAVR